MATAAIDTLATYEAIAAAGIDDRGARAISKAIADSAVMYREDLATKSDWAKVEAALKSDLAKVEAALKGDLAKVEAALKSDLAKVEAALKGDLAKVEAKLDSKAGELRELIASTQNKTLVWMFGMLVTFSGIIIGVIKLT